MPADSADPHTAFLSRRQSWPRWITDARARQRGLIVSASDQQAIIASANRIRQDLAARHDDVIAALRGYTTRPNVEDEIVRTNALLRLIADRHETFVGRAPRGAGFMPRNQLLYSLFYAGVVPAQFAEAYCLRPPQAAHARVKLLADILDLPTTVPQLHLVDGPYFEFVSTHARGADFVVFTGSSATAERVLGALSGNETVFVSGYGHNPIVVLRNADITHAADLILQVCLYNQGQDCSAPAAVLCPEPSLGALIEAITVRLTQLAERDTHLPLHERLIGPNTDPSHVRAIVEWLANETGRIVYGGVVDEDQNLISPTVIVAPLETGPRYREWFAPVITVQPFRTDRQLQGYFGTALYAKQAMYVTVLGDANEAPAWLRDIHPPGTLILNESLHSYEQPHRPYGGYGSAASFVSIGGARHPTPILLTRDIRDLVVAPRFGDTHAIGPRDADRTKGTPAMASHRTTAEEQIRAGRLGKLESIRSLGIDPYPSRTVRSATNAEIQSRFADLAADAVTSERVTVSGRVLSIRNSGMFLDLNDATSKIQVYSASDSTPQDALDILALVDLGDIVEATGIVRRTKRGELTINTESLRMLSKALLPPPEKFHGVTDVEVRYRKRYLDIMGNSESRDILLARFKVVAAVRAFLTGEGFLEVETPMLQPVYGGANARPFRTHHNTLDLDLYLRIAPELYLKKLLVGGISDRIFELNRNFRNEGVSTRHNPEFTMLEVYQAYTDSDGMMDLVERLVRHSIRSVRDSCHVKIGDREADFDLPFTKVSMIDAVSKAAKIDFRSASPDAQLRSTVAKVIGREAPENANWGELVELVFEELVEPNFQGPTHVVEFPSEISPLAKPHPTDPRLADRFETFAFGMEIANAFSEMNDPVLQRQVLQSQVELAKKNGDFEKQLDEDFLEALEYGMPPAGGLGVGIDRLAMIAAGVQSIREVIAFPLMRPVGAKD